CVPRFAVLRKEVALARSEGVFAPGGATCLKAQELLRARLPSLLTNQYEQAQAVRVRARPTAALTEVRPGTLGRVEVLEAVRMELGPLALLCTKQAVTLTAQQRALILRQIQFARELSENRGPQEYGQVTRTGVVARYEAGPELIRATAETRDLTVCC